MQIEFAETGHAGGVLSLTASVTYAELSIPEFSRLGNHIHSDSLATGLFRA